MEHVASCHFLYVEGFHSDEHEVGKQMNINVFLELPGVEWFGEQQSQKCIAL